MRAIPISFILAALPLLAWAEDRTWTNHEGKTLVGEFVRADRESVVIRTARGEVSVRLNLLSAEDQAFVSGATEEGVIDSDPTPKKSPTKRIKIENREWQTQLGLVQAKFIRYQGMEVVLTRGNHVIRVPFLSLREEDQDYVREVLESQGRGKELPAKFPSLDREADGERMTKAGLSKRSATPKPEAAQGVGILSPVAGSGPQPIADAHPVTPAETVASTVPDVVESPPVVGEAPVPVTAPFAAPPSTVNFLPGTELAQGTVPLPTNPGPATTTPSATKPIHEQELDFMHEQNAKAYYLLGGFLAVIMFLGPIVYGFQRFYR